MDESSVNNLRICKLKVVLFSFSGFDVHVEKKTYAEAKEVCKKLGRRLFQPKSSQTNVKVTGLAKGKGVTRFWIGIHNIKKEKNFVYESSSHQIISWNKWNTNEPNDWASGDVCVEINSGKWNDIPCTNKLSFVCEMINPGKFC